MLDNLLYQEKLLSLEEEQALTNRMNDKKAFDTLILAHAPLVGKIARNFKGYNLPMDDLISCGFTGLVYAAHRFDPTRGARFATYVEDRIRYEIAEYVLKNLRLMRVDVSGAHRKCFYAISRMRRKHNILRFTEENAGPAAEELGVEPRILVDMEDRLQAVTSLDTPVKDGSSTTLADLLVDGSTMTTVEDNLAERQEYNQQWCWVQEAITTLNDREQDIIRQRKLMDEPPTLNELAVKYNVSSQRIRQLETRAMEKIISYCI